MKSFQFYKYILFVVISISLIACTNEYKTNTIDGVWQSIGYGQIIEIANDRFSLKDVTTISCLTTSEGNLSEFGNRIHVKNDTLTIIDGINIYNFLRLKNVPSSCENEIQKDKIKDPIYNFEVLATTLNDHYAYFNLRKVNWDSLYNISKNKITIKTTEAELYIIMEDMLDSFNDGHISLSATEEIEMAVEALRKQTIKEESKVQKYGDFKVASLVRNHYLGNKKLTKNSKVMHWGIIDNNIGYIQVNLMMGHAYIESIDSLTGNDYWRAYFQNFEDLTSEAHTGLELEGLNNTLNNVMKDLNNTNAIILDVRFNGGGKDEVALDIMKRFNPQKHKVFSKKANYKKGYSSANYIMLENSENAYLKPVYLLTSQQSASATEIMILSSLGLSHVTRIGSRTEGVFSDVLDKVLPNGWEFGLSNEVYLDNDGNNYEGKGISPHIDLEYPLDRQTFFRRVVNNLETDKQDILNAIRTIEKRN